MLPVLAVLASPRRQEMLRLVWDEERCAGDIHAAMPDITFGAVSLQLKALADAGLVTVRADGRYRYYRARREALGPVGQELERVWATALWRLKIHAELRQARRGPRPGTARAPRPDSGASLTPATRAARSRKGSS
ncbi:MAG: helix-turn-helix domain-containing protein [Vicinamibacteraceae bacterium]